MLSDCYQNKPRHAWFISSAAGSAFGLALTLIVWALIAASSSEGTFYMIVSASLDLFFWQGVTVLLAGVVAIQLLYHYFNCFNNDASSASIASWLAATPIFIILTYGAISLVGTLFALDELRLFTSDLNSTLITGIIAAASGLIVFEYLLNERRSNSRDYYRDLFLMIIYNIAYTVILQYVLSRNDDTHSHSMYIIALLPYFWLGFMSGTRDILSSTMRNNLFLEYRTNIRKFLRFIIMIELIGMFVFYFEYFGLTELNAALVSVIIGAHIIVVYSLDQALKIYSNRKNVGATAARYIKGELVFRHPLIVNHDSLVNIVLEISTLLVIISGIVIATV